jgi:archaellum biogenesis ATPase FlaH
MTLISQITPAEIKDQLSISSVLRYYGGECTNQSSGAWWCIMHEAGGKDNGHKTPSLVAKDERGTATCMSRHCFYGDDIFDVIAKMERLDIKNEFATIKAKACSIAGIHFSNNTLAKSSLLQKLDSGKAMIAELGAKHIEYLNKIGISKETACRFGLKARYDYILYPQLENGVIQGYKGISITKDKATNKSKQFFENYTAPLFHEINLSSKKHLIFCEGEKDCMRLTEEIIKNDKQKSYVVTTITTGAKSVPNDIVANLEALSPLSASIIYDNDKAGTEGSLKLANVLHNLFEEVTIYHFPKDKNLGYDVTDFLNEGNSLQSLLSLEKTVIKKEEKTLQNSFPNYVIDRSSIIDTLTPDKVLLTGYLEIDEKCPIVAGENTIIVGRTGKGKTVLGVNFVNGILRNNQDAKIIVFSLELKKKAFLQRLLAAEYDIELWKIKKGFISDKTMIYSSQKENYLKSAYDYIKNYEARLLIIDDINSLEQIEKIIEELTKDISFIPNYILIDYANILSLKNAFDLSKHIQISTWMKFLAKKSNIHIQAICQANRATKENDDGYARTENLADSDQYGRDAFVVYSIKTSLGSDKYSINPTKNRNGKPEEEIELTWNAKSGMIAQGQYLTSNDI